MALILVLSGFSNSGKSTLSRQLEQYFEFRTLKTSGLLSRQIHDVTRSVLIASGDKNDDDDKGQWLVNAVGDLLANKDSEANDVKHLCVDRIRKSFQVDALRKRYGWQVTHVHLSCPKEVLRARFDASNVKEDLSFEKAYESDAAYVDDLAADADLVIDTNKNSAQDTLARVAGYLKLTAPPDRKCVDVIIGGQFGSEGKGQIAAYLAREYDVLVRVGGPNAGHTVLSESGKFTYHHLPSGSKDTTSLVLLGAGTVINPEKLLKEIEDVGLTPDRLGIDPDCIVITPEDIEKESISVRSSISSTAQGVGQAAARKIVGRGDPKTRFVRDVPELAPYLKKVIYELEKAYKANKKILLEGTQGSGLSLHHGQYPYVTSRDTNVAGCLAEAGISPARVNRIIMVCRTYPIRVANPDGGTSGALSNEITIEEICSRSKVPLEEAKEAEKTSTTGRPRRFGEFDWYLFRKSCTLNAPTDIALTFTDYITVENRKARRFDQLTTETILFIEELERLAHCPVSLISTRFAERSIIDRRNWGATRGA